jgi:hypothetical protein
MDDGIVEQESRHHFNDTLISFYFYKGTFTQPMEAFFSQVRAFLRKKNLLNCTSSVSNYNSFDFFTTSLTARFI